MQTLRRLFPRKLQTLYKFYKIFNHEYGHSHFVNGLNSSGRCEPHPWMTYPCIEFLKTLDLSDCRVFEYGSGSSTLFWSKACQSVDSIEREGDWYRKVVSLLPKNATLKLVPDEKDYYQEILKQDQKFDVIVVDGAVRYACLENALKRLSQRGFILLDNTEWYPNCAELLRRQGFCQIDFCGFPPINAFTSCTSIFFRSPELLSRKKEMRDWAPMGARKLEPYDDCPFEQIDPRTLVTKENGNLRP